MSPKEFISRLQDIAQDARHHPEPAVAVALLAQLLLELAVQIEPIAVKFSLVLQASGFPGDLQQTIDQVRKDLDAASVLDFAQGAAIGLDVDQVNPQPIGFDQSQDTTGTAG